MSWLWVKGAHKALKHLLDSNFLYVIGDISVFQATFQQKVILKLKIGLKETDESCASCAKSRDMVIQIQINCTSEVVQNMDVASESKK